MITVTSGEIQVEEMINSLRDPDCGAVISYLGTVRSYLEGKQSRGLSFIVTDEAMKQSLEQLEYQLLEQFDVKRLAMVHRIGSFDIGDDILFIAISAGHRGPAFESCAWLIDRIKELHDVWKQEELAE